MLSIFSSDSSFSNVLPLTANDSRCVSATFKSTANFSFIFFSYRTNPQKALRPNDLLSTYPAATVHYFPIYKAALTL